MLKPQCLCGKVRLEVAATPDFVHECNCAFCRNSGAWWGYFHPSQVNLSGCTTFYTRADKAVPAAELHFCAACGATTHFVLSPAAVAKHGNSMMGVNMRLADEGDLAGIELRFPDGRNWSGEGQFDYVREARILGE